MPEMNIAKTTVLNAIDLADHTSEGFVLAITAAYMAGLDQGKAAAKQPDPPAA